MSDSTKHNAIIANMRTIIKYLDNKLLLSVFIAEIIEFNNLYYNTRILCVCVWHSIGSAPGRDTDLRPVSLEPAWP
jgi:hypothetical protein